MHKGSFQIKITKGPLLPSPLLRLLGAALSIVAIPIVLLLFTGFIAVLLIGLALLAGVSALFLKRLHTGRNRQEIIEGVEYHVIEDDEEVTGDERS